MRRVLISLLVMLACCGALAEETALRPELADGLDRQMQRLSVMSQQDEAFEDVRYNGGYLPGRGCQPTSVANALIAAFGVEDRQAAIALVKETTEVLVAGHVRGKGRMELPRIPLLLSAQERMAQAREYPGLARLIGGYAGTITALDTYLSAQVVEEHFDSRQGPAMLVGLRTVHPDWAPLLEIINWLHETGRNDATLCLASIGVGRANSGAPLASGKNGHYLSLMIHVGTFMEQGRIYVLDSLPRALKGEESGYTSEMHQAYPFAQRRSAFSDAFDAARISETVIRLTLKEQSAWRGAPLEDKARMIRPLLLYGPGVLMIHVPETNQT